MSNTFVIRSFSFIHLCVIINTPAGIKSGPQPKQAGRLRTGKHMNRHIRKHQPIAAVYGFKTFIKNYTPAVPAIPCAFRHRGKNLNYFEIAENII